MVSAETEKVIKHVRRVLQRQQLTNKRLLLAVSGGADSLAMAYLVSRASGAHNCLAVTVDHGLRTASGEEAQHVHRCMRTLGVAHETRRLTWDEMPLTARLEEAARVKRYAALAASAQHGVSAIVTGHHSGDQAETFLLRFLRHSGVYGLAGMQETAVMPIRVEGLRLVRPLLGIDKQALFGVCQDIGIAWREDASNTDVRFRRNALRQAIARAPTDSPLHSHKLLAMCRAMQKHRLAIDQGVTKLLAHVQLDQKFCLAMLTSPAELLANRALAERLFGRLAAWTAGTEHPELAHVHMLLDALSSARPVTAAGCLLLPATTHRPPLLVRQPPRQGEIKELVGLEMDADVLWDRRLHVQVSGGERGVAWSVLAYADARERWPRRMAAQRKLCAAEYPLAALAATPVVCVAEAPVFALGKPVDGDARGLEINVRAPAL